jgi:hypothetical protein
MNYKRLLFLWLLMVMFSGGTWAQTYTDHIVRSYKMSAKSSIEVYNKYGKVHVKTWEKDSVRFEVDLKIHTTSSEKLRKLKNQIDFDFTSTNYYIVAKTNFTKSGGIFSDFVETIVPSNDVVINYTIYIPEYAALKIENKFGDVYIDDFTGNLDLSLSNGNLKANSLLGNTTVNINTGHGVINKIEKGRIDVSYSEIEMKNIGKIDLNSKHSEVYIAKANEVKINSKSDMYTIREVYQVQGNGNFTKLIISKLFKEINFSNKYYGITIESVDSGFNFINLVSEYTDLDIMFEKGVNYNLDITHHEDVHLTYPASLSRLQTKSIDEENKLMLTYGPVGPNVKTTSPKVKIVAEKKCYVNIIQE